LSLDKHVTRYTTREEELTIHGIIFDLGWTLVDFTGDISIMEVERARDVSGYLSDNGFDLDGADVFGAYREEMRVLWEVGSEMNYEYPANLAMLRALRRFLSHGDAARLSHGALAVSFESLIPLWQRYPDTISTLTTLRDAGHHLGCISNTNDDTHVQQLIDRNELRSWLSPIYTSAGVGLRKPHPAIFQMLLDDWALPPSEVVMVGDTLNADVLGAHNVGMRGVWVNRGPTNPWSRNEESRGHILPEATIQQLAELPALLNGDWGR
jgi:HAD superfamily hydrolase (TIGR01662 family)